MHPCRCFLALAVAAAALPAAEIHPVKGTPIKGEIVSVSDAEVIFTQGDKKVTRPIKEVLKIDLRDVGKLPSSTPYAAVELTDGTTLLASKVLLKKREFELTLLLGPTVRLPASVVASVLFNAQVEAHRRDWKSRVFNLRNKEAVVVKRGEAISSIEAVLGEGDEAGELLTFAVSLGGETRQAQRKLASLHGLVFKHTLSGSAAPVTCKLLDTLHDVVMVSSVTPTDGGLTVSTPAGAKITFSRDQLARLDYTKGKLEYLSDLEPEKVVARSNLDDGEQADQWHVYKDTNLNKGPLTLGGATFAKGLALKPHAELTYDLKGEYREFEAVIGIDDNVSAAGAAVLVVEGDGKELTRVVVSSDDKQRSRPVVLNVKDVQKLRVIVKADGEFDTGRHLDLADAKVRKE